MHTETLPSAQTVNPATWTESELIHRRIIKSSSRHFNHELAKQCRRLLKARVLGMEFPGGRSRKSCRLFLKDGRSVIATLRSRNSRAATETLVLEKIGAQTRHVPSLLATDGNRLIIQEDLPGKRLSEALYQSSEEEVERLLDQSLSSLAEIHQAGSTMGLDQLSKKIGVSRTWLIGFLDRPAVIGSHLKNPPPRPGLSRLLTLLTSNKPRFIKWDARPGNAMVNNQNEVSWFDWEHSGARNRLDDVAWLLGDEFVPDHPQMEARLLERHLAHFADTEDKTQAREYLYSFGVFHSLVRLGLILKHKQDSDWWDLEKCIAGDKVGVTLPCAQRICLRASRWASYTPATAILGPWLGEISVQLESI